MARFKLPMPPAKLRELSDRFDCGSAQQFPTEQRAWCFVAYWLGRHHNRPITLRDLEITPPTDERHFWTVAKR